MKILTLFLFFLFTFSIEASEALNRRKSPSSKKIINSSSSSLDVISLDELKSTLSTNSLEQNVDWSEDAVLARLEIYIRANDSSAVFSELKGNRVTAASLSVFGRLTPLLSEILSMPPSQEFNPVGLVGGIITIFIKFGVNVLRAPALQRPRILKQTISKLKSHHRPILAFFILCQDDAVLEKLMQKEDFNLYAVNQAILMLPSSKKKLQYLQFLYDNFPVQVLDNHKIPQRLFRDEPDIAACQFVVEKGFTPSSHPFLFQQCCLPHHHPKWEYFAEFYTTRVIDAFLESGLSMKPQSSAVPRRILPFVLYPPNDFNHPRWELYSRTFGPEIVASHKKKLFKNRFGFNEDVTADP